MTAGPTPHGVGGLKSILLRLLLPLGWRPTPHGVGGLKYYTDFLADKMEASHPSRGGWIEISTPPLLLPVGGVPPLTGWVD